MTTTDRMGNLDSRREITDRTGQTVILGNSVGSAALDAPASIAMGAAGKSEATAVIDMDAAASMDMQNASFGIWAVFWNIIKAANFSGEGASIINSRHDMDAVGALSFGTNGGGLINVRSFSVTQSPYTPTAGTVSVVVELWGGGGGGGGAAAAPAGQVALGSGGGAGSYAIARITSGFSGVTITIGAAGTGGGPGGVNGANGGASSFGSLLIASGGVGGNFQTLVPANARYGGDGGVASGSASQAAVQGERGRTAYGLVNGPTILASGGRGANTIHGAGGLEVETNGGSADGGVATGFGSGGGGAGGTELRAARTGGNGKGGLCIVWEYNT